jgi:hypothetical protein
MIRCGLICKYCSDGKCQDKGTKETPIEIECPKCDGEGCEECDGGHIVIEGCPNTYCREISNTVGLIDLYEKGLPPVQGGSLDQSVWFVEAAKVLNNEEAKVKAELYADRIR